MLIKYRNNIKALHRSSMVLLLLITIFLSSAYAARQERLIEAWQPVHFDLAFTFDDTLSEIVSARADVTVVVRRKDATVIDFDFGSMRVNSVSVGGKSARFDQRADKLNVYLEKPVLWAGERVNITINYSGKPQDGLILTKDRDGKPSAIGDNWPDRVHHWIPCLDHPSAKASVRFEVTAPTRNEVTANGILESKEKNTDGTTTWTYYERNLISPYNMVIAAGQFGTATLKAKSAVPIIYYVTHSDRKYAEQGFSSAPPAMDLFSRLINPYPYSKLALIVGATRFGGMENANTIIFSPELFKDFETATPRSRRYKIPEAVENVVAHEIAHQWFGDAVTQATWADLWLSEGFATYFAAVFLEKNEGPAAFRAYMTNSAKAYFDYAKKKRTPVHDTETAKLLDLLNPNNYEKGAWVLHSLRKKIGDVAFFEGLRLYYERYRSTTATTEDLRRAFEKTSGENLEAFFDRWIYKAGHPIYKVTWTEPKAGELEIKLTQTQGDEAFLDTVVLEIVTAKGPQRVKITPKGKEAMLTVKSAKPKRIIIDPDDVLLNDEESKTK